jgi:hypothetical protein
LEGERDNLVTEVAAAEENEMKLKVLYDLATARETKLTRHGQNLTNRVVDKIGEYKAALTALRDEITYHSERIEVLETILGDLTNERDENAKDPAVDKAISRYDELKGHELPECEVTEEQLDLLEQEEFDFGSDDVNFGNEYDETSSLRILLFIKTNKSPSSSRLSPR